MGFLKRRRPPSVETVGAIEAGPADCHGPSATTDPVDTVAPSESASVSYLRGHPEGHALHGSKDANTLPRCAAGHDLKCELSEGLLRCDDCGLAIGRNHPTWTCPACDFDRCSACAMSVPAPVAGAAKGRRETLEGRRTCAFEIGSPAPQLVAAAVKPKGATDAAGLPCARAKSRKSKAANSTDADAPAIASATASGVTGSVDMPRRTKVKRSSKPIATDLISIAVAGDGSKAEIEALVGAAHGLGHVKVFTAGGAGVPPEISHVVVPSSMATARLPMRAYVAAARGLWVLDASWVFSSLEAGRWLVEEAYELRTSGVREARLRHASAGGRGVLAGRALAFWKTYLPESSLSALVRAADGTVASCHRLCDVLVSDAPEGSLPKQLAKAPRGLGPRIVPSKWLFDTICNPDCHDASPPPRPQDVSVAREEPGAAEEAEPVQVAADAATDREPEALEPQDEADIPLGDGFDGHEDAASDHDSALGDGDESGNDSDADSISEEF